MSDQAPSASSALPICDHPIFLIGAPRSGTSVVAWALAQHPQIWASDESDFLHHLFGNGRLTDVYAKASARPDPNWLRANEVSREEFFGFLGAGINALFTSRSGGHVWVDQSSTYTLMADLLLELFPGARLVHVVRDGRAVVRSMINSGFDEPWATDFRLACRAWAHYVTRALSVATTAPDRVVVLPHAHLLTAPESVFSTLLARVELPDDPACARFVQENRINSSFAPRGHDTDNPAGISAAWSAQQRATFWDEAATAMLKAGLATLSDISTDLDKPVELPDAEGMSAA